jgi:hypothetical protein
VNPVVAWKVSDKFSIAAGPHISYSQAEFKQGIFVPGDEYKFKGDDISYSFNAGMRWQPIKQLALGVNYRYLTTMNYDGYAKTSPNSVPPPLPPIFAPAYFGKSDASASIRFPQSASVGISYRPTPKWNFEINADWTDWDNLNSIVVSGPPIPATINLNYRSSWIYEFGITHKFDDGWYASIGYMWSENSSPDAGFQPLFPDSNLPPRQRWFRPPWQTLGLVCRVSLRLQSRAKVTGSPASVAGQSADGKYEVLNHAFNLAATFKFLVHTQARAVGLPAPLLTNPARAPFYNEAV